MSKNNKKTKQILSLAMIGAIGTSFAFASPNSASAAQISPIQNVTANQVNPSIIENLDEPFKKIFSIYHQYYYTLTNPKFQIYQVLGSSVEADDNPVIKNSETLFVGKSIFRNNTDQDQTYTTNEFSKTIEHSVSSATTHGFNLGVSTSVSFGIPTIGEASVELSTEYNFSNTNENTKTQSYTYTASPQNIVVPAHSAVEVLVTLNTNKISGNVKLLSRLHGQVSYHDGIGPRAMSFNSLVHTTADEFDKSVYKLVKTHSEDGSVSVIGSGKYEAQYGTEFSVTVKPVVASPKALAVTSSGTDVENSKSTNEDNTSTNEGYTYTVKPEVKKEQ
ncbi:ETX/MTX2 family pore-forming toxin [Bacillus pseudomycoides]|uniref:ETX/MTX2 family pore-forming toxin n=1 Tax=Bacillus TaxID=1386 RepID=UPI002249066C|nr:MULTISPECIES: ETX/MTX2 family pore-forming toxin [Bacillus]MCX2829687.1 ETX/MTX2 family pore-forming toxin [Bacillus sp. DHT2]MDR4918858.1 ETX/MTX2 family pore-forming toxin [Bacillus pseudomycoides]